MLKTLLAELVPGAELAGLHRVPGGYRIRIRYQGRESRGQFLPFSAAEGTDSVRTQIMREALAAALDEIAPPSQASS
ncbi:MAG: hypothetical protein HY660_13590 [Armatimonadetes bacterium]|nr:hypothetical protein [Armatimonadota bacterium]